LQADQQLHHVLTVNTAKDKAVVTEQPLTCLLQLAGIPFRAILDSGCYCFPSLDFQSFHYAPTECYPHLTLQKMGELVATINSAAGTYLFLSVERTTIPVTLCGSKSEIVFVIVENLSQGAFLSVVQRSHHLVSLIDFERGVVHVKGDAIPFDLNAIPGFINEFPLATVCVCVT
jgi:hypothetical protein